MKTISRILRIAAVGLVAFFCSGCASMSNAGSNLNLSTPVTEVVLSQANFQVVGTATGVASSRYILGFGGMGYNAATNGAKAKMYKHANLVGSQAIANVNVETQVKTYFGIVNVVKATASGTIVEFTK